MNIAKGLSFVPGSTGAWTREPGVDFDLDGTKSALGELINLGGLFPLARIADRLPFSESTLRRWARKGPFADCFVLKRSQSGEKPDVLLVHLDFLEERFQSLARQAEEEDKRREVAEIASFCAIAGCLAV